MSETLRLGTTTKRLDTERVEGGVELECPHRPGLYVTILPAASWNQRWKDRVRAENERAIARMKNGTPPAMPDFFGDPDFIVSTLVGGMRGLYDAKGEQVEYTTALGVGIIADPTHADVKEWVVLQAQRYGQFYREEVEADSGNSGRGSSGKRAGAARSTKTKS
jgi:hypothetical protein